MAYASGKYALAVCDTCSWAYKYRVMKTTWEGNRVCPECYEPKHPQLGPEVPLPQAGLGVVTTIDPSTAVIDSATSPSGTRTMTFTDDPIGSKFSGLQATGSVNSLTVST